MSPTILVARWRLISSLSSDSASEEEELDDDDDVSLFDFFFLCLWDLCGEAKR